MIIISVDLGKVRTGLAICDKFEMLASPLCVITEKNRDILAQKICKYVKDTKAELIVVGLPKNMDGTQGESSKSSAEFCEIINKYTNIKTVLWDERCTTISATSYLNNTNVRGKKRKNIIDAVSAVIILENYLNYRKNLELKQHNSNLF